jgi:hypothetical protein
MRFRLLIIVTVWLGALQPLAAQAPTDKKEMVVDASVGAPGPFFTSEEFAGANFPFWAQVDYILWRVKNGPLPVPIVTTGDPNVGFDPKFGNTVNTAGALDQPGTAILFGRSSIHLPLASGVRLTAGGWISEDQRLGIEGGGFVLQQLTNHLAVASNTTGSPALYFPIFSSIANAERAIPIADPLRLFSGDVSINSASQLWGAEGNLLFALYRHCEMDFSLLAGFRYANLRESLRIHNTTNDLLFGNTAVLNDSFQTSNEFYGGQLGSRFALRYDFLSLTLTSKIALGSIHQIVNIQGDITQIGPNPLVPPGLGTFPGGLYAQSSNIGRFNPNPFTGPFSILPSIELKLGFQVSDRIRAFAGYDFLYWNQLVRPGNLINHTVNLTQNAVLDPNGAGVLVGDAQPTPLFRRSDYWAQGVSLGVEIVY